MRWPSVAFLFALALSAAFFASAYTSPLLALSATGEQTASQFVIAGTPTGYVNDFAHVLSDGTRIALEKELTDFEASTTNEIAVAIVSNMGGDYVENYAVKLFGEWKIGKNDQDNGVLLLLSIEEHKLRIEVGYGLEGALPDSLAQRILDDEMTPRLRVGDYDGAVTSGVYAIEEATRGEYTPKNHVSVPNWLFEHGWLIVFGIVFVFQWLAAILGRSKRWWPGGILGVVAGLAIGWFFAFSVGTLFIVAVLGLFGLFFDFLVSKTYREHVGRGASPPWWTGGGGSGSSGGGSFGGFGGGSSGGGGASGSW